VIIGRDVISPKRTFLGSPRRMWLLNFPMFNLPFRLGAAASRSTAVWTEVMRNHP